MILDATFTETKQIINGEFGVLTRGEKGEKGDKGDKGDPGYVNINDSSVAANETWSSKKIAQELTDLDYAPAIELDGSGEVITLRDSSNRPFRGLNIYGKTTQFTTTGKNLLENVNGSGSHNGIEYTLNADGSITCKGTSTAGNSFKNINYKGESVRAIPPGDYIISGGKDGARIQVLVDSKSVAISENNNEVSFTVPETATSSWVRTAVAFEGTTVNTTVYPMLRLASITDDTYEPYTGGIPSPNPDYPQELESVGMSKNLLSYPYRHTTKTQNGVTFTDNGDGTISTQGTATDNAIFVFQYYSLALKAGTYTVSGIPSNGSGSTFMIQLATQSGFATNNTSVNGDTFTLETDVNDLIVQLVIFKGFNANNMTFRPQIELGTVATPYKPYGKGNIGVTVLGKNLLNCPEEVTFTRLYNIYLDTPLEPGTYTVSALITTTDTDATYNFVGFDLGSEDGANFVYANLTRNTRSSSTVTIYHPVSKIQLRAANTDANSKNDTATYKQVQIEKGDTATEYEPYKTAQTLTAQTPNGLLGIPVPYDGNYTDESGQQWICDEVDFAKGVYVQRIVRKIYNGTETWENHSSGNSTFLIRENSLGYGINEAVLSDKFPYAEITNSNKVVGIRSYNSESYGNFMIYVRMPENYKSVVTQDYEFKAWLAENPLEVMYALAEPIYHDLSPEELAQYSALHTNKPNTTIFNDSGAYMALDYVADTKAYIDQKIADISAAMLNA